MPKELPEERVGHLPTPSPRPGQEQETKRRLVAAAVAALPALPDDRQRYAPRPVTVGWLLSKTKNTRRAYYQDLALWLAWCSETGLDPLSARRVDADAWASQLAGARRTIARRVSGVSAWYRYLIGNDICDRNPFAAVDRPRVNRDHSPTIGITTKDAAALLDAADDVINHTGASEAALRDSAVLRLLLETGVRVGALLRASVDDLIQDSGHRVLRYVNKGGHQKRAVVPPHAAVLVDRYLSVRAARLGMRAAELDGPLFATMSYRRRRGGKPLTQRAVWTTLRRLARRAGIVNAEKISPHSCRRYYITAALRKSPLERVQAAVGHQDPRTTLLYQDDRDSLDASPSYHVAAELAGSQHIGDVP